MEGISVRPGLDPNSAEPEMTTSSSARAPAPPRRSGARACHAAAAPNSAAKDARSSAASASARRASGVACHVLSGDLCGSGSLTSASVRQMTVPVGGSAGPHCTCSVTESLCQWPRRSSCSLTTLLSTSPSRPSSRLNLRPSSCRSMRCASCCASSFASKRRSSPCSSLSEALMWHNSPLTESSCSSNLPAQSREWIARESCSTLTAAVIWRSSAFTLSMCELSSCAKRASHSRTSPRWHSAACIAALRRPSSPCTQSTCMSSSFSTRIALSRKDAPCASRECNWRSSP
mmetsp:Transcript_111260/g.346828  ORF Transcript_111260/g.346828 Transcript_111260/m.346828 type:complete len:289 (+) Transcript_111260:75-941(+)